MCFQARDEFFVTHKGEPLTAPMVTLVSNALQVREFMWGNLSAGLEDGNGEEARH